MTWDKLRLGTKESVPCLLAKSVGSSFEANRQTVRILLRLAESGLPISAQLIDAVMKYKDDKNFHDKFPPYFLSEIPKAETIFMEITQTKHSRHPVTYLMEGADDTAYLSSDLEDYLRLRNKKIPSEIIKLLVDLKVSKKEILEKIHSATFVNREVKINELSDALIKICIKHIAQAIKKALGNKKTRVKDIPERLNKFAIDKCTGERKLNLLFWDDTNGTGGKILELKKHLYNKWILKDSDLQKQENDAEKILREIWYTFLPLFEGKLNQYDPRMKVVPQYMKDRIKKLPRMHIPNIEEDERYRLLCDFISGMTDRYAVIIWEEFCSPVKNLKAS